MIFCPDVIVQMTGAMLNWLASMEILQQQAMLATVGGSAPQTPEETRQQATDLINSTKKADNNE